ncbi:MAG: preprotein translocase subunit YajC [Oscillospiraceae bacterium]
MDFNTFLLLMPSTGGAEGSAAGGSSSWLSILMLVAMFGILYFLMIRPQKKQEKADAAMRESIQIGDEVITVGGIMGRVVTLKEDSIVIETGADKTKIRITRTSIYTNVTSNEKVAANRQAQLEAAKAKKNTDKVEKKPEVKETKKDDKKEVKEEDKKA